MKPWQRAKSAGAQHARRLASRPCSGLPSRPFQGGVMNLRAKDGSAFGAHPVSTALKAPRGRRRSGVRLPGAPSPSRCQAGSRRVKARPSSLGITETSQLFHCFSPGSGQRRARCPVLFPHSPFRVPAFHPPRLRRRSLIPRPTGHKGDMEWTDHSFWQSSRSSSPQVRPWSHTPSAPSSRADTTDRPSGRRTGS